MLPLIADLYEVTCDELIKGTRNASINVKSEESRIMTEGNIKRILNNSFEKFKRDVNLCKLIIFSAFVFALFGLFSYMYINNILGIVLGLISIIAYISVFFLFSL